MFCVRHWCTYAWCNVTEYEKDKIVEILVKGFSVIFSNGSEFLICPKSLHVIPPQKFLLEIKVINVEVTATRWRLKVKTSHYP